MADTIHAHDAGHRSIKDWPGWDYVPGIAYLVVGILALAEPLVASLATSLYLGVMLCVAGGFMLAGGIARMGRRGAWLALLTGLLALVAGVAVLYNPVAGGISLVWVMGAWLIVTGLFELATGFKIPVGRGWLIFVGLVNVALGVWLLMTSPAQAFVFLGYFVGISLALRGMWSMFFTADLHRAQHAVKSALS